MLTVTVFQFILITIIVFVLAYGFGNAMWSNWVDYGDAFVEESKKKK